MKNFLYSLLTLVITIVCASLAILTPMAFYSDANPARGHVFLNIIMLFATFILGIIPILLNWEWLKRNITIGRVASAFSFGIVTLVITLWTNSVIEEREVLLLQILNPVLIAGYSFLGIYLNHKEYGKLINKACISFTGRPLWIGLLLITATLSSCNLHLNDRYKVLELVHDWEMPCDNCKMYIDSEECCYRVAAFDSDSTVSIIAARQGFVPGDIILINNWTGSVQ